MRKNSLSIVLGALALVGSGYAAVAASCYTCETDINEPTFHTCVMHGNPDVWEDCELGETLLYCGGGCGDNGGGGPDGPLPEPA